MKNYIYKIAKDNLNKNREFYKYIFISVFLVFFFITFSTIISFSIEKNTYQQNSYYYGKWDSVVVNCNEIQEEMITESIQDIKTYYMFYSGEVLLNNHSIGSIGYFESSALDITNIQLIEGRFAENSKEIVLEKSMIDLLKTGLNQDIELTYCYDTYILTKEFKIVGIINDYTNNWLTRGLSFISYDLNSYEYDIFIKSESYITNLWNSIHEVFSNTGIEWFSINNEKNYPHINYRDYDGLYTTESLLLPYTLEIILVSFVAVIITMISSLDKRESQFVLFRSIGMTYKQLQKLIVYEGYLLSIVAFFLSTIFAFLFSIIFMAICCYCIGTSFVWHINYIVWIIQIVIISIFLALGIILPTLTVYDLPLTRKGGQYIYHPKKNKFRKPTFINLIFKEFKRYLGSNISLSLIILCILIRGNLFVLEFVDYSTSLNYYSNLEYEYDYALSIDNTDSFFKLLDMENIDINSYKCYVDLSVTWENINTEVLGKHIGSMIMSIDDNYKIQQYLLTNNIDITHLQDNQCIMMIPDNSDTIEKIKEKYGLEEGGIIESVDNKSMQLEVIDIIHENDIVEDLNSNWNLYIIVNEKTLELISKDYLTQYGSKLESYLTIKAYNQTSRENVKNYLHKYLIENDCSILDDSIFLDNETIREKTIFQIKNSFYDSGIYSGIIFVLLFFMVGLIRLLSSYKLRKDLGLLNILGMTKKKIYMLYYVQSTFIFLIALCLLLLVGSVGSLRFYTFNIIVSFLIYLVYIVIMLIPIRNILKIRPLELIHRIK